MRSVRFFLTLPLVACVALAHFLVSAPSFAQNENYMAQTGIPTFTVMEPVENGFINLANGNLHIEIPVTTTPERRGKYTPAFTYDSRIWGLVTNQSSGSQYWFRTGGGWRLATTNSGNVSESSSSSTISCNGGNWTLTRYSNFLFIATDGTRRLFLLNTSS